jgi:hypothetical protein
MIDTYQRYSSTPERHALASSSHSMNMIHRHRGQKAELCTDLYIHCGYIPRQPFRAQDAGLLCRHVVLTISAG